MSATIRRSPGRFFGSDRQLRYLPTATDLARVNFDDPAEVRSFARGKFELYRVLSGRTVAWGRVGSGVHEAAM